MDVGNAVNIEYNSFNNYNASLLSHKNPILENKIPDFSAPFKLGASESSRLYVDYTQNQRDKLKKILKESLILNKSKEESEKVKENINKVIGSIDKKETDSTQPKPESKSIKGAS